MDIAVVTLFPEMFAAISEYGVSGRAVQRGAMTLNCINPRDFTHDRHQTVDDRPFGGGPGMVMKAEPLCAALQAARDQLGKPAKVVYLSPQGKPLSQSGLETLSKNAALVFLAGRYEGVDERLIEREIDEEWSIGDYVISGGELAAMVMIDGISRLLPGVLGHEQSAEQDSFSEGLLDCPHYTRPEVWEHESVPEVLRSGNHGAIRRWRLKQALGRTYLRRPDLLEERELSDEENTLLAEFLRERDD